MSVWNWISPYTWGVAVIAMLYLIGGLYGGAWNPMKLVEGSDGRPSSSKFQWLFWTVIVLFSYVVLYVTRARFGYDEGMAEIPTNVLYAMGFSAMTLTAAKGVTVGYVNSGRLTKTEAATREDRSISRLLTDDEGYPDLTKIQMMAWTLLTGAIYLTRVMQLTYANIHRDADLLQMPDIDKSLMLLMGLGQGTYLGKKVTSMDSRLGTAGGGTAKPGS
jgi:hypothetical protein